MLNVSNPGGGKAATDASKANYIWYEYVRTRHLCIETAEHRQPVREPARTRASPVSPYEG
jgi:hypothetical protein